MQDLKSRPTSTILKAKAMTEARHAMLWLENEICEAEVLAKFLGRCEYEGRLLGREESPRGKNELQDLRGKLLSPGIQTLHSSRRWFT